MKVIFAFSVKVRPVQLGTCSLMPRMNKPCNAVRIQKPKKDARVYKVTESNKINNMKEESV